MSHKFCLISYPTGQSTSNMALRTILKSVKADQEGPKITVRLTTSLTPFRFLAIGYTCRDTVFMGVGGTDFPGQHREDLMILRETLGPRHGEPLLSMMQKFPIATFLKSNPFTLSEVWGAFDNPEKFKDGVSRTL